MLDLTKDTLYVKVFYKIETYWFDLVVFINVFIYFFDMTTL